MPLRTRGATSPPPPTISLPGRLRDQPTRRPRPDLLAPSRALTRIAAIPSLRSDRLPVEPIPSSIACGRHARSAGGGTHRGMKCKAIAVKHHSP